MVADPTPPGYLAVRPVAPFLVLEQDQHGLALVGVATLQAMRVVRADRVKNGLPQAALVKFAQEFRRPDPGGGRETVPAIGKPCRRSVGEGDRRRKRVSRLH